jgi:Xaa-Pro aminopeptidase
MIMLEPNGPGGFYGECGRTWVLGEPPQELLKVWNVAVEAQHMAANLSRPGADPAEILEALNRFLAERGYAPETRLFAHGQGYDLVERPAYRPGESMRLKSNMVLAIHPTAFTDTAYGYCCDDYLVGEQATERLHKTPQEVIVVDC